MCLGAIGVIERVWDEGGVPMAMIDGAPVCLIYTPLAAIGDSVLIHIGYAMEIIDAERAADASALRRTMAGPN